MNNQNKIFINNIKLFKKLKNNLKCLIQNQEQNYF